MSFSIPTVRRILKAVDTLNTRHAIREVYRVQTGTLLPSDASSELLNATLVEMSTEHGKEPLRQVLIDTATETLDESMRHVALSLDTETVDDFEYEVHESMLAAMRGLPAPQGVNPETMIAILGILRKEGRLVDWSKANAFVQPGCIVTTPDE